MLASRKDANKGARPVARTLKDSIEDAVAAWQAYRPNA